MQVETLVLQGFAGGVRALTRKEEDLVRWDGDTWVDPNEAGDIKTLNSNEFSVPVEVATQYPVVMALPHPSEEWK